MHTCQGEVWAFCKQIDLCILNTELETLACIPSNCDITAAHLVDCRHATVFCKTGKSGGSTLQSRFHNPPAEEIVFPKERGRVCIGLHQVKLLAWTSC